MYWKIGDESTLHWTVNLSNYLLEQVWVSFKTLQIQESELDILKKL